jgi:hypothetical protein
MLVACSYASHQNIRVFPMLVAALLLSSLFHSHPELQPFIFLTRSNRKSCFAGTRQAWYGIDFGPLSSRVPAEANAPGRDHYSKEERDTEQRPRCCVAATNGQRFLEVVPARSRFERARGICAGSKSGAGARVKAAELRKALRHRLVKCTHSGRVERPAKILALARW